jgi:predicted transcriptional regulator
MARMRRPPLRHLLGASQGHLESVFGRLELRVLEALWSRGANASVRALQADFPHTAYTTLMTTLDRLHRKGVVERLREGRAFLYRSRYTREELRSHLAAQVLGVLLGGDARPILSCVVDLVSHRDQELLGELEALVRAKRRREAP